jgi:hypothetical protein
MNVHSTLDHAGGRFRVHRVQIEWMISSPPGPRIAAPRISFVSRRRRFS